MKRFFASAIAALTLTTGAWADNNPLQIQDLNGSWVVRMDNLIDGTVGVEDETNCRLNITSDGKAFRGAFNGCMEGVVINGNIYDNQLLLAVQSKENDLASFCTFSGKVSPDGAIRGTYYTATTSGDFEWRNSGVTDAPKPKPTTAVVKPPPAPPTPPTPPAPVAIKDDKTFIPKASGNGTQGKPVATAPSAGKEVSTEFAVETKTATPPAPVTIDQDVVPAPTANTLYHVVEEGDNVYQLHIKYGLSSKKILWLNNKTTDRLDTGERLRISE